MPLHNGEIDDDVLIEIVAQGGPEKSLGWVDYFGYPLLTDA